MFIILLVIWFAAIDDDVILDAIVDVLTSVYRSVESLLLY